MKREKGTACSHEGVVWLHCAIRGHLVSDGCVAPGTLNLNRPLILNSNRGLYLWLVVQRPLSEESSTHSSCCTEALTARPLIVVLFVQRRSPSGCNFVCGVIMVILRLKVYRLQEMEPV